MKFDFINSLKEFFFDIIGFLVPGLIVIVIVNHVFGIFFIKNIESLESIVIGYVIGYIVFSFSLIKDKIIDKLPPSLKISSSKEVIADLSKGDNFKLASERINNSLKGGKEKLVNYKSLRNYAMSVTPESDQKVFTFMFRAELFNQLHTVSLLFFIILTVMYILSFFELVNNVNYYLWGLFFILTLTLRQGWKRFYTISMNIPFSLYLAKSK